MLRSSTRPIAFLSSSSSNCEVGFLVSSFSNFRSFVPLFVLRVLLCSSCASLLFVCYFALHVPLYSPHAALLFTFLFVSPSQDCIGQSLDSFNLGRISIMIMSSDYWSFVDCFGSSLCVIVNTWPSSLTQCIFWLFLPTVDYSIVIFIFFLHHCQHVVSSLTWHAI